MLSNVDFGKWKAFVTVGCQSGHQSIQVPASVANGLGQSFQPFNTNAAIIIGEGSSKETITPTTVDYVSVPGSCVISANYAHAHGVGDLIQSGTQGQKEAINYVSANGGGQIYCVMQELITLDTVATHTDSSSNMFPANSIITGCSAKVVQTISGGGVTSYGVGGNGSTINANTLILGSTNLTAGQSDTSAGPNDGSGGNPYVILGVFSNSGQPARISVDNAPTQGSLLVTVYSTITVP